MSNDVKAPTDETYAAALLKHREILFEQVSNQLQTFDKTILGVSSGALGISIAFVDKFSGPDPVFTVLLFASWISFATSICFNIISNLTSSHDALTEIRKIDNCLRTSTEYLDERNLFRRSTEYLNYAALVLFFIGVLLLALHAYQNMEGTA